MRDNVSHMFKNVFICAMLLINFSLILFILLNDFSTDAILINGKIFGLGDSFWGSLFGAIITGSMAIKISNREQNKRTKEKEDETRKVLLNLKEYAEDLMSELSKINAVSIAISKIFDPYSNVEVEYDDFGNQHVFNFPPIPEIEEYESLVNPKKRELRNSNETVIDLLDKINIVEINELNFESYEKVLTFKQISRKKIEPIITYSNKMRAGIISEEERKEINEIILNFHDTVSK